jgi:hypothetical protein
MGEIRRHKRIVAWLAIVGLVSHSLLAALYLAPSKVAPLVDEIFGSLVICTSHGAATAPDDGGSNPYSPSEHCAACVLIAKIAVVIAVIMAAMAFPVRLAVRPVPIPVRSLAVHLSLGGIRSRAPPLSA